ncbi:MAG: gliding motility-associated C-terminal domain-containing protein [Saprospiraceae bacterium]|nr:gliding motility-associated C-terminal domain-containing protein [Saprospiraceae bacterium]
MRLFFPILIRLLSAFAILAFCPHGVSAQCPITVDAGEDVFLCPPTTPMQLNGSIGGDFINFTWSPTTGMTGSNTLTPTVNVSTSTNYILRARAVDASMNLIVNGDFEQGNTGFTSDYIYNPGFALPPFGTYEVTSTPAIFPDCPDHTSGNGEYMVIDGSDIANQYVWCQTVTVLPNSTYNLSSWGTSFNSGGAMALLEFTINGTVIGTQQYNGQVCNWSEFTATWNSGSNTSATICIENLTVTGANNDFAIDDIFMAPVCEVTDTVTVHVINLMAIASPVTVTIPCAGANATLNGTGSSTGPNISYLWETGNGNIVSGETTLMPVINQAGTYTLTVSYDFGTGACTRTATVNVIENPNPIAAYIGPHNPLGCGSSTITLNGFASQGNVVFVWTTPDGNIVSGSNNNNAVVDQPGTYELLVTNTITGCTATAETYVGLANNPPTAIATVGDTLTCLLTQDTLSGAGSTLGATISYQWTTVGGQILSGQNTLFPIVGAPGTYILAVTNSSNNCTAFDTVQVLADILAPGINFNNPGIINCMTDTLTLTATVTPPGAALFWTTTNGGSIIGGNTGLSIMLASPGMYSLTATNIQNGCSATLADTISTDLVLPVAVAAAADTLSCQNPTVTLSGAGSSAGVPFTYEWTGGNVVSGGSTLTPVVNAAGIYILTVLNTINGCTSMASATVVADPGIVNAVATAPDTLDCVTSTITLSAAGSSSGPGIGYQWTTIDGQILSGGNTATPVVGEPGLYVLTVNNSINGCSSTDQVAVQQDTTAPVFGILPYDTITCLAPIISINALPTDSLGVFQVLWSTTDGNIAGLINDWAVKADAPGSYTIVVTNIKTGCTASQTVQVISDDSTPVAVASVAGSITCATPQQTLSSTGSSSGPEIKFVWTAVSGGNIVSGNPGPTVVVDTGGIYELQLTNSLTGCSATTSVVVLENTTAPVTLVATPDSLTCSSSSDTLEVLNVNAGWTYAWQSTDGIVLSGGDTPFPIIGSAGTYALTVTDPVNGCTFALATMVFNDSNAPVAGIGVSDSLTCAHPDVFLPGSGSTGIGYFYQWTGPGIVSGVNTLSPLVNLPGLYTLLVTNTSNGCTDDASVVVVQDTVSPQITITPPAQFTCGVTAINLMAEPSVGPYAYTWSASAGGNLPGAVDIPNPEINAPGVYTLTVINVQNGCTASANTTVTSDFQNPVIALDVPQVLTCDLTAVTISGNVVLSSGNVLVLWTATQGGQISGTTTNLQATALEPGMYTLNVVDLQNGCNSAASLTVLENILAPAAEAGLGSTLTCSVTETDLDGSASASGPGISYGWSGPGVLAGATTIQPTVNQSGWYQITVTDAANGCFSVDSVQVLSDTQAPILVVATPMPLTCVRLEVTLDASGSDAGDILVTTGIGNILSGANTPMPVVNAPGTYTFLLTNTQNGCTTTSSVAVPEDLVPPTADAGNVGVLSCNQPQTTLTGSANVPSASFAWSTTNGNIVGSPTNAQVLVNAPGAYQLIVTDLQNGCTGTDNTAVTSLPLPTFTVAVTHPDCLEPLGALAFTNASGGGTALMYSVNGGQTFQTTPNFTNLAPGDYTMVLQDDLGCTSSETTTLNIPSYPQIELPASISLEIGDSTVFYPVVVTAGAPITSWNWLPAEGLSCADCANPTAQPLQTTFYQLIVTDANGCTATAGVQVLIDKRRWVYAPNVFSPNDDGVNDWFTLFGNRQLVLIEKMSVYDRWGNMTWQVTNLEPNVENKGWDGKAAHGGEKVMPGVFVWTAQVRYLDGTSEVLSGDVTVVR